MPTSEPKIVFVSPMAPLMEQFVRHKRAIGYRYQAGAEELKRFDRFLSEEAPKDKTLSRAVVLKWLAKRPLESASTQRGRFTLLRQFALFLCRLGYPAHVPDGSLAAKGCSTFMPTILTHTQVKRLLFEVDRLAPTALSPLRHLIMPEVFRLLYGCGFRVGEVLKLRVADVDLNRGVLTVRDAKFGKNRLVPPALPLVKRLRFYNAAMDARPADAFFFPSHRDGPWSYPASSGAVPATAAQMRHSAWRQRQGAAAPRPSPHLRGAHPDPLVPRGRRHQCQAAGTRSIPGPWVDCRHPVLPASDGRAIPGSHGARQPGVCRRHSAEERVMKPTDLSVHMTAFLTHHLAAQRNLSPNTVRAYRDVFHAVAAVLSRPPRHCCRTAVPQGDRRDVGRGIPRPPRTRPPCLAEDPEPPALRFACLLSLRAIGSPGASAAMPADPGHSVAPAAAHARRLSLQGTPRKDPRPAGSAHPFRAQGRGNAERALRHRRQGAGTDRHDRRRCASGAARADSPVRQGAQDARRPFDGPNDPASWGSSARIRTGAPRELRKTSVPEPARQAADTLGAFVTFWTDTFKPYAIPIQASASQSVPIPFATRRE